MTNRPHIFRNRGMILLAFYPMLACLGIFSGAWAAGMVFGTAILLLLFFGIRLAKRFRQNFDWAMVFFAASFFLLSAASCFWTSGNPIETLAASLTQLAVFVAAMLFLAEIKTFTNMTICTGLWVDRLMQFLVIAAIIALLLFLFDWLLGWPIQTNLHHRDSMNSYNKGISNLILLLMPVIGYFAIRKSWVWFATGLLCVIIFALISSNSTAKVALFIALLTMGVATIVNIAFNPLWLRLLIGIQISLLILLAPLWVRVLTHYEGLFVKLGIKLTFLVRLEIWNLVNRGVWAHPWIGHGWRSSRALSLNNVTNGRFPYLNLMGSEFHFYPHNQMLQIWYDLGIGGALIIAGMVIWITLRLGKLPRELQAPALAAMAFVVTTGMVNYDLATDAWWALMAAVAGLFLLAAEGVIESKNPAQIETIFSRARPQKSPENRDRTNYSKNTYFAPKNTALEAAEDDSGWR